MDMFSTAPDELNHDEIRNETLKDELKENDFKREYIDNEINIKKDVTDLEKENKITPSVIEQVKNDLKSSFVENVKNVELINMENRENSQNSQILQNSQNRENIQTLQNSQNDQNLNEQMKPPKILLNMDGNNQNTISSKGFLSPPAFHVTEIMHNEKCLKKTKGHITVEINGDICVYGGMEQNVCIDNFVRYVPGINLFEKMRLNSEDIPYRAFHSGNVITEDNKKYIVVFGGINAQNSITDEAYKFDFQARKWEHIKNECRPPPRYKHASFSFDDVLYIHGGLDVENKLLSDLWCLSQNKWTQVKQLGPKPEARYGHSLMLAPHERAQIVFLFGGNKQGFNSALSDIWMFNINTNIWRELRHSSGSKPCARWGHSTALIDNEWMVIYGGFTNGWIENYALSDMYAMNIYNFSWYEIDISSSKAFNRGYFGSLCLLPYKKSLHVFGGTNGSNECSDVFSMSPLATYASYKALTGVIEQLHSKIKHIDENGNENGNGNDNAHINLAEFELKFSELKNEVNNINNMMRAFETKFAALEKLNEQCGKLLSKNINAESLEKLEKRIMKLESSNALMKHDSI
ncbi:kelch domain-containing protein, putative [Plasmodium vinckei vinckei]|uniref:Kelch domain-containing protein, putative n=1 Tax=Plasmodium vinckei vinckei TaxID=54757 RepID=A0A449BSW6_PLAVN|nr:kelch domain-containing protein, putative [Plasmodium vinckei vinckei]KEG02188.1 hypothetical protein YYE_02927 [Plasmodium vinckei vinckei]VEV56429.1 kelch domain-containing protein, putative [Plasmodium vinckei vinckei]